MCIRQAQAVYDLRHPADDLSSYVYENIDDEHYFKLLDTGSEFPCLQ